MSTALEDVCKVLNLNGDSSARETVAVRIIDLANAGERNPKRLRDRVLHEAAMASRVGLDGSQWGSNNVAVARIVSQGRCEVSETNPYFQLRGGVPQSGRDDEGPQA